MDDFPGLLARDFGFRPQGKSTPMSTAKGGIGSGAEPISSSTSSVSSNVGKSAWNSTPSGSASFLDDGIFGNQKGQDYGDKFVSMFQGSKDTEKSSSLPVYDKPVYDEDIFDGVPGIKSTSNVKYDDIFGFMSSPPLKNSNSHDDLLGNLGRKDPDMSKGSSGKGREADAEVAGFDDLIPGFGATSPTQSRETSEINRPRQSGAFATKPTSIVPDDPFVILESNSGPAYSSTGLFSDHLDHISKSSNSGSTKVDGSSASGGVFNDFDAFDGLTKSMPSFSSDKNNNRKESSPLKAGQNMSSSHTTTDKETTERPSTKNFENTVHKRVPVDNYRESHQTLFDMPAGSSDSHKSVGVSGFSPRDINTNAAETNSHVNVSPKSEDNLETAEIWLTVSEIPLFTQPTNSPPPSRPPPPPPFSTRPAAVSKADKGFAGLNSKSKVNEFSSFPQTTQNHTRSGSDSVKSPGNLPINELKNFAMGKPQNYADGRGDVLYSEEEIETNSAAAASAAAMKEAMDRAEAKFKHAKEFREREAKAAKSTPQEVDEKATKDAQEREQKEKQERLDREREQREREEREREQRRAERERERARQAVERATREARERAALEARQRAERAAVEKAHAEARERAGRAAVQKATLEARERAAAEAKERAERAAAEARERAAAEARERADARERERAAVERAAVEVRQRAERAAVDRVNAEARERAAAAAREKQHKNDNDLDSIFGMGARPNSVPRQRATTSDPAFDTQFQSKGSFDGAWRTSSGTASNIRKASSTTTLVDDLTSIFGGAQPSGEFQEVEGESEERRRARLDRHQRTRERAAKALAEKNERDIQAQREQAERHRLAEILDSDIKRWAAGKEGNLRALLSTLQYVLWPECGWQPISLTDLITGASVKKVYRKATLCIHPDKVQQKGATLQQKYIAEKVFDLLKFDLFKPGFGSIILLLLISDGEALNWKVFFQEAWNKFNSEELF